jgi:DNA-binding LytR/AlgR family response regulator
MNILICDDFEKDANELAAMLSEFGVGVKASVFTCPWQAFNYFQSGAAAVDVCFLDIIMPSMNGIKLAEKVRESNFKGEIIFLTTSNNFASQSYHVKAFDYLLKPIDSEKLNDVMSALQKQQAEAEKNSLSVNIQGAMNFIPFCDISYVEVLDHTVYVNMLDKSVVKVNSTLDKMTAQLLQDGRFVRLQRSCIVNLNEIKSIANREAVMKNGIKIAISRTHSQIKDRMLKQMFAK